MSNSICNFFAILKDDSIRKIDLLQTITTDIKTVFVNAGNLIFMNADEILFDGNLNAEDDEILYVDMAIPTKLSDATSNPIGCQVLNLSTDEIKNLFWVEGNVYYFQNFDNRKLLQNKNVIFWDNTTFNKLTNNALIVDNVVDAVIKDSKLYFKSYANANKIFSLLPFFAEASNEVIDEFATIGMLTVDSAWLKENSDTIIRKQITLIQKSGILNKAKPEKIIKSANKFNLAINLINGKLVLPNDKKQCKAILTFLNEQYYIGLITGKKFKANSKKDA